MKRKDTLLLISAKTELPFTEWVPGELAMKYLYDRLPGCPIVNIEEIILHAIRDGQIVAAYKDEDRAMVYGYNPKSGLRPTASDLILKRDSFKDWADKVAPGENEHNSPKGKGAAKPRAEDEALHPRSKDSLLKMVFGMAVGGYGYDPKAKRNEAIADITADLHRLGLSLSDDTVRKWLDEAAECYGPDVADL